MERADQTARGRIFNIQRFSVQDGPGIRTTVFLKGCPLRCLWCHNPESYRAGAQILYHADRCTLCGSCAAVCPAGLHVLSPDGHSFHRSACRACGLCAGACPTLALELCGKTVSPDEVLSVVLRDREFYQTSGGGITLSGGEPLFQSEFSLTLMAKAKSAGLHVCVETCGFCPPEVMERAASLTDLFLYDFKLGDDALHRKYTGVSNRLILSNLSLLDALGAAVILRCPIIPEVNLNDGHFRDIAALVGKHSCIRWVELEPYHPLGISKRESLAMDAGGLPPHFLEPQTLEPFVRMLRDTVPVPVSVH